MGSWVKKTTEKCKRYLVERKRILIVIVVSLLTILGLMAVNREAGYIVLFVAGGLILAYVSQNTKVIIAKSKIGIIVNIVIVLALGIIAIFTFITIGMLISGG